MTVWGLAGFFVVVLVVVFGIVEFFCQSQDRYYVVALRLEYLDQFSSGSLLSVVCVKYFRSILLIEIRSLTALLSEIDQVTISGPLCLLFERSIDCCNSRN